MTMLLLKYGANPNPKRGAIQSLEHSPLIKVGRTLNQNQNEENEVVVKELLIHGADLMLAVDSLCSVLKTSYHNSHDVMMILTTLVKPKYFSQTKDPIRTAHHINHELTKVIKIKEEYQENCEKMILLGREFTYAFLDACTSCWDARRLLFNSNFIEDALQKEEKKFLSHPLCQEIILTEFYGSDKFKSLGQQILLILEGISAALNCCYHVVFLPIHLIQCGGSWKYKYSPLYYNVRTLNTAYYSFLCDAFNHMVLLVILPYVATSIPKTYKAVKDKHIDASAISYIQIQRGSLTTPTFFEITLWLCILSRILTEVHQIATKGFKKYSSNFWNFVDVLMCISLISASGLRLYCLTAYNSNKVLENQDLLEDLKSKTTWAIYIYSITQVLAFFRVLNYLGATSYIGPLQLAVKLMVFDVMKLVIILAIIILGHVCAIYSVASCYRNMWIESDADSMESGGTDDDGFWEFSTFDKTLISITWSLFDIFQYDNLLKSHTPTYRIILVLVLVYSIIGAIIILNILIAMLNNTYTEIQKNMDAEWKFSRSELFMEYKGGPPWLFPLSLITTPVHLFFHLYSVYHLNDKKNKHLKGQKSMSVRQEELCNHYDKISTEVDGQRSDCKDLIISSERSIWHEMKMRFYLINKLEERLMMQKQQQMIS